MSAPDANSATLNTQVASGASCPRPIFCLLGPTASGKTALALDLVQRFPLQIISFDSVMVYRGLDIGSAKPSTAQQRQAPHRMIDCCDPDQEFNAGAFYNRALQQLAEIEAQGDYALCVGGSMLYFNLWQHGLSNLPAADPLLRAAWGAEADQHGAAFLHAKLQACDPEAARNIAVADHKRVVRALEVYQLTGKTWAQNHQQRRSPLAGRLHHYAIYPDARRSLDQPIRQRVELMLAAGLVAEVQQLEQRYALTPQHLSMQAVGYRQVWRYLAGELSAQALVDAIDQATRRLAKHQMTWLRRFQLQLRLADATAISAGQLHGAVELAIAAHRSKLAAV